MSMYVYCVRAMRGLVGAVGSLTGTVLLIAEVGPGVAEVLVDRTYGSVVWPQKSRTGTEGGGRSREVGTGVSGVLFQTGRTGTRVWWLGLKWSITATDEGPGYTLIFLVEPPYLRLTARPGGSSQLQGDTYFSGVSHLGGRHGLENWFRYTVSIVVEPLYLYLTAHPGRSP